MRFLPICISVLLLAAGAGCSAYLLERLRSSHISLAILGAVLTLVLLAYFATGRQEKGAWVRFGLYGAAGRSQELDAGRAQEAVAPFPRGQGDGLHAQALGPLRPLPRRRPHLPYEQRRRKGTARYRFGQEVVAVRRLRPRRRACGGDVHPHRHRQAQQCQSAGLARRRPRPHRRDAAEPARRTPPVELARQTRSWPAARGARRRA